MSNYSLWYLAFVVLLAFLCLGSVANKLEKMNHVGKSTPLHAVSDGEEVNLGS